MSSPRTGARLLVEQLLLQGVNHLFCVPGESFLAVLDAAHDVPTLRLVVNRHESGTTFMAAAHARLTAQPAVAFVTRGPGACNAAIGVHLAFQDALPMVLFIGQSPTGVLEREAFQEIDLRRMFGPIAKWVVQVDQTERIPEFVGRAFQTAASGRPGPVVVVLPEDVLDRTVSVEDARCHQPVLSAPSDTQIAAFRRLLGRAMRPIAIVGGPGWNPGACENLRGFAEANQLPVACAFRHQDVFDNRHANYAGELGFGVNPKLAARVREADLVIALGARLDEVTTGGYTILESPVPRQALIHVHADVNELGRVFQADLMINTGMPQIAARLSMTPPIEDAPWADTAAAAHAELAAWQSRPQSPPDQALDLWQVMRDLRAAMPEDAIVCNGAGNFSGWLHRFFPYYGIGTQLAPANGSMGYAVPAAISARISAPDRTVVCVSGDGDSLMSAQEMATGVKHGAPVLFLVFNNGIYGTIRMHQEQRFPGRVVATGLSNPDFPKFAEAFGAAGFRVSTTAQFAPALESALTAIRQRRQSALIELVCDPKLLSPTFRLPA
jgi:acetolactate synthase I/II/III large subunit